MLAAVEQQLKRYLASLFAQQVENRPEMISITRMSANIRNTLRNEHDIFKNALTGRGMYETIQKLLLPVWDRVGYVDDIRTDVKKVVYPQAVTYQAQKLDSLQNAVSNACNVLYDSLLESVADYSRQVLTQFGQHDVERIHSIALEGLQGLAQALVSQDIVVINQQSMCILSAITFIVPVVIQEVDDDNIPFEFKCPLSLDVMDDPVRASDNFVYERIYIQQHIDLSMHPRSPMTRELLTQELIPVDDLRERIRTWSTQQLQALVHVGPHMQVPNTVIIQLQFEDARIPSQVLPFRKQDTISQIFAKIRAHLNQHGRKNVDFSVWLFNILITESEEVIGERCLTTLRIALH